MSIDVSPRPVGGGFLFNYKTDLNQGREGGEEMAKKWRVRP